MQDSGYEGQKVAYVSKNYSGSLSRDTKTILSQFSDSLQDDHWFEPRQLWKG